MPVSNPNNLLLVTNSLLVTNILIVGNSLEMANQLMGSTFIARSAITTAGSSTLNTTGATLLVAVLGAYNADPTISDSKGNTWNYLTSYQRVNGTYTRIAYAYASLSLGAGHTFTAGGTSAGGVVLAFSGTYTGGDPYDGQVNGATSTFAQGAITPSAGDLVICGFMNNDNPASATIVGAGADTAWSAMVTQFNPTYETGAAAWIQASGAALNPTMAAGAGSNNSGSATIAGFKHA
jgi:hypothetical protein